VSENNGIDWAAQWAAFAPNFYDGKAHIDLSPHGILELEPGGGFGDLSHPTTQLMLDLMRPHVANEMILDIGCGSGILCLASLILGATLAYGLDIDKEALRHAKKNAVINHLDKKAIFSRQLIKAKRPNQPFIILMNMIFKEQRAAFNPGFRFSRLITSGILQEGRNDYINWTLEMGWQLIYEKQEGEWLGFVFQNPTTSWS
jgi:ribosomal protein L11 methyltransferase